MVSFDIKLVFLVLYTTLTVSADYTDFFWPNNTQFCPGMGFKCSLPRICAFDATVNKHYCCNSGRPEAKCWVSAPTCGAEGANAPSTVQQSCTFGSDVFCCLKERENCTSSTGKTNICWATAENPVALLNATRMNETYSSLRAASPSATTIFPIALAALQSLKLTSSSSSSSPSSAPATPSPSSTPIGAIVGGVLGAVILIGAIVAFLLWRCKKRNNNKGREALLGYGEQKYGPIETRAEMQDSEVQRHEVCGAPRKPAELGAEEVGR